MLETRATVVRIDGQFALVHASQGNSCEQCDGKSCGAGKLSRLFCDKPRQFQVDNQIQAVVGDEVIVAVADGVVLRGIGLVYLLPLFLLVIGAAAGSECATQIAQRDGYAAGGAVIGLIVGFALSRWIFLQQARQQNFPYIARPWHEEQ